MSRSILLAATLASSILASPAQAAILVFTTTLSGSNEVPSVSSPGTGTGTVTIDTDANTLQVALSFSGLLGNTTASHIHCCAAPGSNAPVATQVPTFVGFPVGVTAGSYNRVFDLTQPSSFNPAFLNNAVNGGNVNAARQTLINGIIAGQSYLNVHTTLFPGGEIRGQLTAAVPEPSTWAMMLLGFGTIGAMMRRSRRVKARLVAA
jgi:hypothetical protein